MKKNRKNNNRHSLKKAIQKANKHMKSYSIFSDVKERQIKTAMR